MVRSVILMAAILSVAGCGETPGPSSAAEEPSSVPAPAAETAESGGPSSYPYEEAGTVGAAADTKASSLENFCLATDGNLLLCDAREKAVRVVTPEDRLVATWPLAFPPQAVCARPDGTVVVAGGDKVAVLDAGGRVLKEADVPGRPRGPAVTGLAVTDQEVFVCAAAARGYSVHRYTSDLADRKTIIEELRGCCGQMDIASDGTDLYAAENVEFHVVRFDREGKRLGEFGKNDPTGLEGFAGCCEPKNVCVGPDGDLYTASSCNCHVQRFAPDGTYKGIVAAPKGVKGCLRVTLAMTPDGSRIYFFDSGAGVIRILQRR